MAQFAHPQPQEDFPFFLLRTILAITAVTTAIRTTQMMIVAIFSEIHVSISFPPVLFILYYTAFIDFVNLVASLYGLKIM